MERVTTFLGKVLLCVLILSGRLSISDDKDYGNPLSGLNRGQRKHFAVYARINRILREKKELDLNQAFVDTYRPVRDWCVVTAPKFRFESMKAGDKAKTIQNPRVRQVWIEKSALYSEMHENCQQIIKGFDSGRKSSVLPEMRKLVANERMARTKNFPLPAREWLTQSEADNLLFRLAAPQRAKRQADKNNNHDSGRQSQAENDDDTEPRQGGQGRRVRNQSQRIERHGRRGSDGGRQPQRDSRSRGGSRRRR